MRQSSLKFKGAHQFPWAPGWTYNLIITVVQYLPSLMCIIFFQASNASFTWEMMVTGVTKAGYRGCQSQQKKAKTKPKARFKSWPPLASAFLHIPEFSHWLTGKHWLFRSCLYLQPSQQHLRDWLTSSLGHLHLPPTLQIRLFFVRPLPQVFSSEGMEWIGLQILSPGVCQYKVKP